MNPVSEPPSYHTVILPGSQDVPDRLCPEVLTEEEALRYLRLDLTQSKDPSRTLAYYRREWGLRGTQIGRNIRYRRLELDRLLDRLTGSVSPAPPKRGYT